jgi:AcrR family transcriptional regulator
MSDGSPFRDDLGIENAGSRAVVQRASGRSTADANHELCRVFRVVPLVGTASPRRPVDPPPAAGASGAPLCRVNSRQLERAQVAQGRVPGKPKGKADRTRERILAAAVKEFAAKGYSGARVDAICRASRANPRMLYHHFGDKAGLYVAVLEQVIGDLRREELKLQVDHVEPLAGMLQLFDFIHGHFASHPELIHLLSGENLLRGSFLRRSSKTPLVASPLLQLIAGLLRRGERHGVIRKGIDPLHLYVVMVALSYFHRSNAYTLSAIFRTDLLEPGWQEQHRQVAAELLTRFLQVG